MEQNSEKSLALLRKITAAANWELITGYYDGWNGQVLDEYKQPMHGGAVGYASEVEAGYNALIEAIAQRLGVDTT